MTLPEYVAHALVHGTKRRKFSTLHADFLQEKQMAEGIDIQHPKSDEQLADEAAVKQQAILDRIAALESELKSENK